MDVVKELPRDSTADTSASFCRLPSRKQSIGVETVEEIEQIVLVVCLALDSSFIPIQTRIVHRLVSIDDSRTVENLLCDS